MNKALTNKLWMSMKDANEKLSQLSSKERSALKKEWDVEHAYYSSALEGSKLDREDFEKLAENIA